MEMNLWALLHNLKAVSYLIIAQYSHITTKQAQISTNFLCILNLNKSKLRFRKSIVNLHVFDWSRFLHQMKNVSLTTLLSPYQLLLQTSGLLLGMLLVYYGAHIFKYLVFSFYFIFELMYYWIIFLACLFGFGSIIITFYISNVKCLKVLINAFLKK